LGFPSGGTRGREKVTTGGGPARRGRTGALGPADGAGGRRPAGRPARTEKMAGERARVGGKGPASELGS